MAHIKRVDEMQGNNAYRKARNELVGYDTVLWDILANNPKIRLDGIKASALVERLRDEPKDDIPPADELANILDVLETNYPKQIQIIAVWLVWLYEELDIVHEESNKDYKKYNDILSKFIKKYPNIDIYRLYELNRRERMSKSLTM